MKLSNIENLFAAYDQAKWSPSRMCVHFGCDCGCGGDSYTEESWDAEEEAADLAIQKMKALCQLIGVEYDGIN